MHYRSLCILRYPIDAGNSPGVRRALACAGNVWYAMHGGGSSALSGLTLRVAVRIVRLICFERPIIAGEDSPTITTATSRALRLCL